MVVHLGKRKFPAIACSNKKEGRTEAADTALRVLIAEGQYQMDKMNQVSLGECMILKIKSAKE